MHGVGVFFDPGGRSFAPTPGYDLRRLQRRMLAFSVDLDARAAVSLFCLFPLLNIHNYRPVSAGEIDGHVGSVCLWKAIPHPCEYE